jgi:copper homeostasis protein
MSEIPTSDLTPRPPLRNGVGEKNSRFLSPLSAAVRGLWGEVLLEVAVESFTDALVAAYAGADRLELCSELWLGGLTPPLELYLQIRSAVSIPIVVMIRPRAGHFCYHHDELNSMVRQIESFRLEVPAGFVFGALHSDGSIDLPANAELRASCGNVPAVFHRAWDEVPRTPDELESLIALGFSRILTSGGAETALMGASTIQEMIRSAAGRIEILPGAGIRSDTVAEIVHRTSCRQVHGTFKKIDSDQPQRTVTDPEQIRATRAVLVQCAGGC